MLDKRGDSDLRPVERARGRSTVTRTALIAVISLSAWTAVMLGLVSAGALQLAPALVLILLAIIVLGVEVQRARARSPRTNRFGTVTTPNIDASALRGLLDIEQASSREERNILLAREFCRLTADALQPDPATRVDWPTMELLASWREQIALLLTSTTDSSAAQLPPGRPRGSLADAELRDAIEALRSYVALLSRLQEIASADPEPLRQLTSERRNLRTFQDQVIARLSEPTNSG